MNEIDNVTACAYCPHCDNPTRVTGYYRHSINGETAYKTHTSPKRKIAHPPNKNKMDTASLAIYNLLREQFDRVIYVLSQSTGIRISTRLAEDMLWTFTGSKAWLCPWLTLNNLPWVFGNLAFSKRLYGQFIKKDTPLYNAILNNCPEAELVPKESGAEYYQLSKKHGEYLDINFCLMCHERKVLNDELRETIEFVVTRKVAGKDSTVLRQTIEIDETYFLNLVNLSEGKGYRNQQLIDVAKKYMV